MNVLIIAIMIKIIHMNIIIFVIIHVQMELIFLPQTIIYVKMTLYVKSTIIMINQNVLMKSQKDII